MENFIGLAVYFKMLVFGYGRLYRIRRLFKILASGYGRFYGICCLFHILIFKNMSYTISDNRIVQLWLEIQIV